MSRKTEREAAALAAEILKAAHGRGEGDLDGDTSYGAGRMTKAQRKSQERHIPVTPGPQSRGAKIWRDLTGF